MKIRLSLYQSVLVLCALLAAFLLMIQAAGAAGNTPGTICSNPLPENGGGKKKKEKTLSSLDNHAVKIYPDIIRREMHVVAKKNEGKEMDFFVFDLQGTLVYNYKMKQGEHYRITGLKKGTYIYRVFSGDMEKATGKFEIR